MSIHRAGAQAQFDAYGRRFAFTLSDNERALEKLSLQRKQQLRGYRLLRGTLDGQPGSWVRLTETAHGVEGAIWDGRDLYAVTSYARAAPQLTTPLAVGPHQTVVYRLSDAHDLLPRDFCALDAEVPDGGKGDGLSQYQSLVTDLQAAARSSISHQIEIALIADSAFAAKEPDDAVAAMLARFNVVEGIFSEQVGLLVMATEVRVLAPESDPFTSTSAITLLEQLGSYRYATPAVRARGLAHLVTGKSLDGTTAGIAYLDSACDALRGVSLSERSYGTTISALLMAHELGHNLGAPHDGEAGACAAASGGFIMAPSVTGFVTFSQCSIDTMRASLSTASCVSAANYADVGLSTPESQRVVAGGVPFEIPFEIQSGGTLAAADVVLDITLPDAAGVVLESATAEGGTCSLGASSANCSFGDLAPGELRGATLRLRGTVGANVTARAQLVATNDRLVSNNQRLVSLTIHSGIDALVNLTASDPETPMGTIVQFHADVASLRALPVRDAVLNVVLNQPVDSASMPGASCDVSGYAVNCVLEELAPGTSARLTVGVQAQRAGPLFAAAQVSAPGDGNVGNNSADAETWVQADHDIEIEAGPEAVDLAVGDRYEIPLLLRSRGAQASGPVALEISAVSGSAVLEAPDAGGSSCVNSGATWRCELGTIGSGDARLVRIGVQGFSATIAQIQAVAIAADDGYLPNNTESVRLRIDNDIDMGVLLASGGIGIEDQAIEGEAVVRSDGRQSTYDSTLDIELPSAGRMLRAWLHEGAECTLLSAQRARCSLPVMSRGDQVFANYRAEFAEPGSYEVKFSLSTPGDTAAANDVLVRPMLVRPHYDIAVAGVLDLQDFVAGQTRESTFIVTTGPRPLEAARFVAAHHLPGAEVIAIRAASGACRLAEEGGACDFADLPAQTEIEVNVTWRALGACHEQTISVGVSTTGDVAAANDVANGRLAVLEVTDLELAVDDATRGTAGKTFALPAISVVNGAQAAHGARLEVSLPAAVTVVQVSAANAICSGTSVLRCDFAVLEANATATVNVTVRASTRGSYTAALQLTAINDVNASNDSGELGFEVAGESTVTASPSGGGGGGSLEWLSLAMLVLLLGAGPALPRARPPRD